MVAQKKHRKQLTTKATTISSTFLSMYSACIRCSRGLEFQYSVACMAMAKIHSISWKLSFDVQCIFCVGASLFPFRAWIFDSFVITKSIHCVNVGAERWHPKSLSFIASATQFTWPISLYRVDSVRKKRNVYIASKSHIDCIGKILSYLETFRAI